MAQSLCEGEGSGWGTIAGRRLRVLVLADPEMSLEGALVVRALERRHDPSRIEGRGWRAWLSAARAARAVAPHLIHAVGIGGAANAARTIALGLSVPPVLSLSLRDVEATAPRRWLGRARSAGALIADGAVTADRLRRAGVRRAIYVIEPPPSTELEAHFLHALEVVYGRLLAGTAEEDDEPGTRPAEGALSERDPSIVRIGSLSGRLGRRGDQ